MYLDTYLDTYVYSYPYCVSPLSILNTELGIYSMHCPTFMP